MNINASLIGQSVIVVMLLIAALSYYLGMKKTGSPKISALIGFLLSIIPILGLIYVALLSMKPNLDTNKK
ncbi:hypothetical protein [Shewanella sp. Isolate11]|uniref:hypothetical protein n=1 Tax=Shewanella sp. Isolate11 TaxID=2908530 RepID=UPI001EFE7256|nr:hypothetical protein [Shewanella sp. Isolate11]MCG9698079.1 hypothetical protein [Shewanella sp. Isolate11]